MKRTVALILALVMTMALVACGGDKPTTSTPGTSTPATSTPATPDKPTEPAVDPDAGKYGGELIMCSNNATSTVDPHENIGSLGNSRWMQHIFEPMAAMGADGKIYPVVCDYEEAPDGLTIKVTLRESYFSNGDKVTIDDVWASIYRAAGNSTAATWDKLWKGTDIKIEGDTITFTFEKYNVNFTSSVFSAGGYYQIMPKEICEKYPPTGGEMQPNGLMRGGDLEPQNIINQDAEVIGTGPYKLESWSETAVVMVRNDAYKKVYDEGATGRCGTKNAYADKITIAINKDEGSRTAAMLAGEYDLAMVSTSMMSTAESMGLQKVDQGTTWTHGMFFNLDASNADSPIADVNVRKAIRAAIDCNAVLLAISGDEKANVLEPTPIVRGTAYDNTIIADGEWNIANQALAKEYLAKSSYNGEPIKWLCTANSNFYKAAMAASGQMEAVGIKVELMVVDSGAHSKLRSDPLTGHDIGGWTVQKRDDNPVLHSTFVTGTQGWWNSDARNSAIEKMKTNPTGSAASVEGYEEWCEAVVDEVPFILFGHLINYNFLKPGLVWNVQGASEYYWNMYWEK